MSKSYRVQKKIYCLKSVKSQLIVYGYFVFVKWLNDILIILCIIAWNNFKTVVRGLKSKKMMKLLIAFWCYQHCGSLNWDWTNMRIFLRASYSASNLMKNTIKITIRQLEVLLLKELPKVDIKFRIWLKNSGFDSKLGMDLKYICIISHTTTK